jgi:hypothetical protein
MRINIELDEQGAIVLNPAVRDVVAQVVEEMWPGRFAAVDDFLAWRLPCGTVPALVAMSVRASAAAVRAAQHGSPA